MSWCRSTGATNAAERQWERFGPRATPDELVWEAPGDEVGRPAAELEAWLSERPGRTVRTAGASGEDALASGIAEVRIRKDEAELDMLRTAATFSLAGFEWVYDNTVAGMTE